MPRRPGAADVSPPGRGFPVFIHACGRTTAKIQICPDTRAFGDAPGSEASDLALERSMASTAQLNSLPITPVLTEFTDCMDRRKTPAAVLDTLHALASKYLCVSVLGAARFPVRTSDWKSTRLGRDAFLHS